MTDSDFAAGASFDEPAECRGAFLLLAGDAGFAFAGYHDSGDAQGVHGAVGGWFAVATYTSPPLAVGGQAVDVLLLGTRVGHERHADAERESAGEQRRLVVIGAAGQFRPVAKVADRAK